MPVGYRKVLINLLDDGGSRETLVHTTLPYTAVATILLVSSFFPYFVVTNYLVFVS